MICNITCKSRTSTNLGNIFLITIYCLFTDFALKPCRYVNCQVGESKCMLVKKGDTEVKQIQYSEF